MKWYELLTLVGLPSILSFLFQMLLTKTSQKVKYNKDNNELLYQSQQALLRDRLRELYIRYNEQGYIELSDKDNYNNMYQIYHKLGVNGVMDDMYKRVMALPISKPK